MGNEHTKQFKHGAIVIRTNEPYYFPGATVSGEVYLSLSHAFEGNRLTIKLKGKEKCRFETTETHGEGENRRTEHHTRWGKADFYRHKLPLFTFYEDWVQPGQYTFPFCFKLNDILPSTFHFTEGNVLAKIYYYLKVELNPKHKDDETLESETSIIIRPKPLPNMSRLLERDVNLYKFCCLSAGHMKLKCMFDKDSYCPGEHAVAEVDMDNSHGSIEIEYMQFMLKNNIKLTSNDGHYHYITHNIAEARGNGIHGGESNLRQTVRLSLGSDSHRIQPSTYGSFIKSEFELIVDTNGSGCGCVYNGSIHHSILMHAELPQDSNFYNYAQPPTDWNPQVMPENNLVLSSEYMYPSANEVAQGNMAAPQNY